MNANCTIPQDRPLGLLNPAGEWIALDDCLGVRMLAVLGAAHERARHPQDLNPPGSQEIQAARVDAGFAVKSRPPLE